jgi:hypothetical protein
MYMQPARLKDPVAVPPLMVVALGLTFVGGVLLGILPTLILPYAETAAHAFFGG